MPIVQTVLGPITPNLLGRTLTHEHLSLDLEVFHTPGPADYIEFLQQRISMETLGYVRQYPYSSLENVRFNDQDAQEAVKLDVELFKKFGGGSIVENTSHGLKRDMQFLVDVAQSTGVHIIAGTGHYMHNVQEDATLNMRVEELTDLYSKEVINGVEVDGVGMVKCGFIGEVGSGFPLHDFEKQTIRATGEIQEVLGCGVSFHSDRNAQAAFEVMRLYLEAGGRANKCVMSHLDCTIFDVDELLEFAKLGAYLQYDLFGVECSFFQPNSKVDMPSDAQRINTLMKLIKEGLIDRILLSQDIHTKHRLTSYGGHGYHHLQMNILPRLFGKGLTVEQVDQITVTNPTNWLQFSI